LITPVPVIRFAAALNPRCHTRYAWNIGNVLESRRSGVGRGSCHKVAFGTLRSRQPDALPRTEEIHQSRSQLMFSKGLYRRCLRAFFPHLFGKRHARAYMQAGKSVAQNAVTMKIDFLTII
jgi:hypothetical protein